MATSFNHWVSPLIIGENTHRLFNLVRLFRLEPDINNSMCHGKAPDVPGVSDTIIDFIHTPVVGFADVESSDGIERFVRLFGGIIYQSIGVGAEINFVLYNVTARRPL